MTIKKFYGTGRRLGWAAWRRLFTSSPCPSCGNQQGEIIDRCRLLLLARRCGRCGLIYRIPVKLMPRQYEDVYYRNSTWYREYKNGQLRKNYQNDAFKSSKWDYYDKLSLIRTVKPGGRVLDFGGGIGVIAAQFRALGYEAELYEIGAEMKAFSEGVMGLKTLDQPSELRRQPEHRYDIVFLHHVLEHLDDLRAFFALFERLLKADGLLACFVPNAGASCLKGRPAKILDWAHVNAFESAFFQNNLKRFEFEGVTFSMPYEFTGDSGQSSQTRDCLGAEMALFAWKQGQPAPEPLKAWPYQLPDLGHSRRAQAGC